MTKKQVSLKDLAKALNISVSTVSRALKNHPDISAAMAQKVQELARAMKYNPNPLAMGLLRRQTRTIGVIVPDLVTHFFSSVVSGIEDIARKQGYYVVITSSSESYAKEKSCIENLVHQRVEGIIACVSSTTTDFGHYDLLQDAGIPLVFFDRVCRIDEFSSVIVDNIQASKQIVRHFVETGCKRIAYLSGPDNLNISRERLEGYLKGLEICDIPFDNALLEHSGMDMEKAVQAVKRLLALPEPPDALFGINDMVVFAALKEIKRHQLHIPGDISIIGFTDDFHASFVEPELTSVVHPTFEMGQEAANLLLAQTLTDQDLPVRQVKLATKLVIRESTRRI